MKMITVIGASGKVGFATVSALRQANVPIRAVLRDTAEEARLRDLGCEIAVADLQDTDALSKAIANTEAVQVIVPLPVQAADGAHAMRNTIDSIMTALEQTRPKRILAISDYGAHVTHDIGMPTMFHAFEQRLAKLPGHKIILRSAEHLQNFGRAVPAAIETGILVGFHDPVDVRVPTISAPDVGTIAASLLLQPSLSVELEMVHAEGPQRYSARDVATALSKLVGRQIDAVAMPHAQWKETLERGLSSSLATLLIKANDARNEGGLVDVEPSADDVRYGTTDLNEALREMLPKV